MGHGMCCSHTFEHLVLAFSGLSGPCSGCSRQTGPSLLWVEVILPRPGCRVSLAPALTSLAPAGLPLFLLQKQLCCSGGRKDAGQGGDWTIGALECSRHQDSQIILCWDQVLVFSPQMFRFYLVMCLWEFSSLSAAGVAGFMTLTELSVPAKGGKQIGWKYSFNSTLKQLVHKLLHSQNM